MQVDEQSVKEKKPRSEAQQASFKAAVEKLKAKRQQDRDDKIKRKAEQELKKVEAKATELKALTSTVPDTNSVADPHTDVLGRIEKLIDERLSKLVPPPPVVVNMPRRHKRHADESGSEDEGPAPPPAPKPRAATSRGHQMPAAWYDALFTQRR